MRRRLGALLLTALTVAGCASAPATRCAPAQQALRSERLYFGTATPQGVVSPDEWRGFVDTVVTPRFPNGLTAWPASGQWRSADGTLVHEASWVLEIVHAPEAASDAAVGEIVAAYKQRFQQEAVLRVSGDACVTF